MNPAKMSHKTFAEIVRVQGNGEYELLGRYSTTHEKILALHAIDGCGHEFLMRPSSFMQGIRCPKCNVYSVNKTKTSYVAELEEHFPGEYEVIGEYINTMTRILTKHVPCGHEWEVAPNVLLARMRKPGSKGCPVCNKKKRRTHEEFIEEVRIAGEGAYRITAGTYITSTKMKVEFLHEVCGEVFQMSTGAFLGSGYRCPHCAVRSKTSKAVKEIETWLKEKGLVYQREVMLEGCKMSRHLKFDFLVDDYLIVEYDGRQHFEVGKGWRTYLQETRVRDDFKTEFCRRMGYSLLRIPYTSDHISVMSDVLINNLDPWEVSERELLRMELPDD